MTSSLPYRQLRKSIPINPAKKSSSLPHRQLRNLSFQFNPFNLSSPTAQQEDIVERDAFETPADASQPRYTKKELDALNREGTVDESKVGHNQDISEESSVYSGYDRAESNLRNKEDTKGEGVLASGRSDSVHEQADIFQGQGDLFADIPEITNDSVAEKSQSVDNFNIQYSHAPTGSIKVGVDKVTTAEEAAHVLSSIRKHGEEVFFALVTDKSGNILEVQRHGKGGKTSASVPVDVVVPAVASIEGAASVWFAHNHPSFTNSPSQSDIDITERLDDAFDGTDIDIPGHVIFTKGSAAAVITPDTGTKNNYIKVKIKPRVRKRTLKVTERKISQYPKEERSLVAHQKKISSQKQKLNTAQ